MVNAHFDSRAQGDPESHCLRPRIAHFDIGGLALESGGEVIDLSGLADLYIGRVGYQARGAVGAYIFDEVQPDMLNIHGPSGCIKRTTPDFGSTLSEGLVAGAQG